MGALGPRPARRWDVLLTAPHAKPRVTGPRVTRTEQCRPRAPSLRVRRSAGLGASVHEHGSESGNHRYRFCWSVGYKFTFCLPVPKLNASKRPLPGSQVHRLCSWPWGLGASAGCFEGTLSGDRFNFKVFLHELRQTWIPGSDVPSTQTVQRSVFPCVCSRFVSIRTVAEKAKVPRTRTLAPSPSHGCSRASPHAASARRGGVAPRSSPHLPQ